MSKSKSSQSSIVVPSTFVIHLVNVAEFINATCVTWCPTIVILPPTKIKHRCNHKD